MNESPAGCLGALITESENPGAAQLYEALGFRRAVDVRDYTHVMDLCFAVRSN